MIAHVLPVVMAMVLQALAIPPGPPKPDFQTGVDYAQWIEDRAYWGRLESGNAAGEYRAILKELRGATPWSSKLNGPRSSPRPLSEVGPWTPLRNPDYERGHQDTRSAVRRIHALAAKDFIWLGFQWNVPAGQPQALVFDHQFDASGFRKLAVAMSDQGWRAAEGQIDREEFVASARTNLRMAVLAERSPNHLSLTMGSAVRSIVYDDLQLALFHEALDAAGRAAILAMLKENDREIAPIRYETDAATARGHDLIQTVMMVSGGRYNNRRGLPIFDSAGNMQCDGYRARDAMIEYYNAVISALDWPDSHLSIERLERSYQECIAADPILEHIVMDYSEHPIRFTSFAHRRATRLLYELFIYHDQHRRWPDKLDDLPLELNWTLRRDPYSGRPLRYRLVGGKPLLYSVGRDGVDNGGKLHDRKWGKEIAGADFIFWPYQKFRGNEPAQN